MQDLSRVVVGLRRGVMQDLSRVVVGLRTGSCRTSVWW